MNACYFWEEDKGTVLVVASRVNAQQAREGYFLDMYCVDTFSRDGQQRYGLFTGPRGWQHRDLDSFPKEFRAHLLLLEVS